MNNDAFFSAAISGDIKTIERCLRDGVGVDLPSDNGFTALMLAAFNGHLDLARALVNAGADVNAQASDRGTALLGASYYGLYEMVEFLLEAGANPNIADSLGETPIIQAAEGGYAGVVALLIESGADIEHTREDGDDALGLALYKGCGDVAHLLIQAGAQRRAAMTSAEKADRAYADAAESRNRQFLDDRMFLMEVTPVTASDKYGSQQAKWAVITRRNVPGYPPYRVDDFPTRGLAIDYLKRVVTSTARVSLGGTSQQSEMSYEEYQAWLASIGVDRLPY